jgi:hypothetical protein
MKRFLKDKTAVLIIGGASILIIIYLIASLGELELKPSKPFAYLQETEALQPGEMPTWNGLWLVFIILGILLIGLFILLPPKQRKRFIFTLAGFVLVGFVIFVVLSKFALGLPVQPQQEETGFISGTLVSNPTITLEPEITPSIFIPPEVSSWESYLVALGILLVVVGAWFWWMWRKRGSHPPYGDLVGIIQSTLSDIESGKDWGDAIMNSYYRMNRAVADWRGINRHPANTPAEFAYILVSAHLPREEVQRLTALFERVRYGNDEATPDEIKDSLDCLTSILDYCGKVK